MERIKLGIVCQSLKMLEYAYELTLRRDAHLVGIVLSNLRIAQEFLAHYQKPCDMYLLPGADERSFLAEDIPIKGNLAELVDQVDYLIDFSPESDKVHYSDVYEKHGARVVSKVYGSLIDLERSDAADVCDAIVKSPDEPRELLLIKAAEMK